MNKIKIKKLNSNIIIPTKGSKDSAGNDLYASISNPIVIEPHQTIKIGTGIAIEIPKGYFGAIFARSGLATKNGLRPSNCVGIIDSDYRGEIIVALHNDMNVPQKIQPMERIAQMIIMSYPKIVFEEVDELSNTARGGDGFGSTGK